MTRITTPPFLGYFGNATDNLYGDGTYCYDPKNFEQLHDKLAQQNPSLRGLFFLKQMHSTTVFVLQHDTVLKTPLDLFNHTGDAIITRETNIGIGVVTADCLPIFLIDPVQKAIGVVHAGWRGLSARIISTTIQAMQTTFQSNPADLQATLGPSANACCYEVQQDLVNQFPIDVFENTIMEARHQHVYFNPKKAALRELLENHLLLANIVSEANTCTICTTDYCSYRREKEKSGRQPSILCISET